MPFTLSLRNQVLNHLFSKDTLWPYTFEVVLRKYDRCTGKLHELTDKSYKRVIVPQNQWGRGSQGVMMNLDYIIFDELTESTKVSMLSLYEHNGPNWSLINCFFKEEFFWPVGERLIIYPGDLKVRLRKP